MCFSNSKYLNHVFDLQVIQGSFRSEHGAFIFRIEWIWRTESQLLCTEVRFWCRKNAYSGHHMVKNFISFPFKRNTVQLLFIYMQRDSLHQFKGLFKTFEVFSALTGARNFTDWRTLRLWSGIRILISWCWENTFRFGATQFTDFSSVGIGQLKVKDKLWAIAKQPTWWCHFLTDTCCEVTRYWLHCLAEWFEGQKTEWC